MHRKTAEARFELGISKSDCKHTVSFRRAVGCCWVAKCGESNEWGGRNGVRFARVFVFSKSFGKAFTVVTNIPRVNTCCSSTFGIYLRTYRGVSLWFGKRLSRLKRPIFVLSRRDCFRWLCAITRAERKLFVYITAQSLSRCRRRRIDNLVSPQYVSSIESEFVKKYRYFMNGIILSFFFFYNIFSVKIWYICTV